MIDVKLLGVGAALGSAASWALGTILFKRIGASVSPFGMTLVKGTLGILLLGIVVSIIGWDPVDIDTFSLLCVSGLLGIAAADTFFFAALRDLGPVVLVVLFMVGQIFTAFLAVFFLQEVLTLTEWVGIGITLAGVCWVLWIKLAEDDANKQSKLKGILFGVSSMICMSCATVIAKPALISISTITATLIRMFAGTVGVLVLGLMTRNLGAWLRPVKNLKVLKEFSVAVAIITFGGFWLSLVAIKYVDVAVASTLSATEPLLIIPLAAFLLKERISISKIAGAVTACSGMFLLIL